MILSEEKRDILKKDADTLLLEVESLLVKLHHEECLQKLQVLINDYELLGEYRLLLKCHIFSALCQYNLGNLKEAFTITNQYEELCQLYKEPIVQYDYYPLLGLQYMYNGNFSNALKYYEMAAQSAIENNLLRLFIASKKHVAHVANLLEQFDTALQAIDVAKQYLSHIDEEDINQIEIYLVEISVYLNMGDLSLAQQQLHFIEKHPVLTIDQVTNSLFYEYYANYYLKAGKYTEAYTYANKGLDLLKGTEQFVSEQDIYELLVKVCKAMGDDALLIDVYEKYVHHLKSTREKSFQNELTKRDLEDMKKLTLVDNLTGVFNRKYLTDEALEWLNLAPMNNESIICSVFDVDHFKGINDTYGHLIGDYILQQLAKYCNELMVDENMFLARYGGDEFVIINRTTNIELGIEDIRKIYRQLNEFVVTFNDTQYPLSISMGLSYTQLGEYTLFEDLFAEADIALYRSKENGRKKLSFYKENIPTS